jgi:hypothetical protein
MIPPEYEHCDTIGGLVCMILSDGVKAFGV